MAADGLEALQQARALRPDLILMDIEMPGCDGLAATRLIKAELPKVKIVMVTVSSSDENLFEAIKSGASGYLLKSQSADRFLEMVGQVAGGGAALPPELAARVLDEFARQAPALPGPRPQIPEDDLTPHQREILALVAQGLDLCAGRRSALSERGDGALPHGADHGTVAPAEPRPGDRLCRPSRAGQLALLHSPRLSLSRVRGRSSPGIVASNEQ